MDYRQFLQSTPIEITFKIEAYNDRLRDQAMRDYSLATIIVTGWHNPKKFPKFQRYYSEKTTEDREEEIKQEFRRQANAVGMRVQ